MRNEGCKIPWCLFIIVFDLILFYENNLTDDYNKTTDYRSRVNQTEVFPLLLLSDVDIINMSIHQDTGDPRGESCADMRSSRSA